jgi:nitronate monooxygenase
MWPDDRIRTLFGIDLPIFQAPMAGVVDSKMVIAVAEAGGLGSLPCALLDAAALRAEVETIRRATSRPINLNFFCHTTPQHDAAREAEAEWKARLETYYVELGVDPRAPFAGASRSPFDEELCDLVVELAPQVVSFHFGLPEARLLERVKKARAKIISSATTVAEARWLEDRGCDAIIAQGSEAGGHRGMFLHDDVATQVGTMALVPQVVDAVKVPVIASGGIADARGIVASFALGASAVQIGTAFLFCPEAKVSPPYRRALESSRDDSTTLTNVFTGRPARSIMNRVVREAGPISPLAPPFPLAAGALAPLRAVAEANGSVDFTPLWAGQASKLGLALPAGELTRRLAAEALRMLSARHR